MCNSSHSSSEIKLKRKPDLETSHSIIQSILSETDGDQYSLYFVEVKNAVYINKLLFYYHRHSKCVEFNENYI